MGGKDTQSLRLRGVKIRWYVVLVCGVALIIVGFSAGLISSEQEIWSSRSSGDGRILSPLSENEIFSENVSGAKAILQILTTPNNTVEVVLSRNNHVEIRWDGTNFKKNIQLPETGNWTVVVRNNSTEDFCNYTSLITLSEANKTTTHPYIWLRVPMLVLGVSILAASEAADLFVKFNKRVTKGTIKISLFIIAIVVLFFSYQIGGFLLGTSKPWVVCQGTSMEPTIIGGDLILLKGVDPKKLMPEDIIVFQEVTLPETGQHGTLSVPVAHRILYINKNESSLYITTKGDNNPSPDDWLVSEQGVFGRVDFIVPKIGLVLLFLDRFEVKVCAISIILLVFFVLPLLKNTPKTSSNTTQKS